MNYEKIGKFISELRKQKGLTQKQLAEKLNITDKAVSKWERGLGCPDVSILELLSKELDVSILEILKGRIIENEIIKITEADDYVKETIKYTKTNIKDLANKTITFIVIALTLLLLILNIENIISMNKKYQYNFNTENHKTIKNNVKKIENNTDIILKNPGRYEKEDYDKICKILQENKEKLKNSQLINETGIKEYKQKEIYLLDKNEVINNISLIELSRIIEKYSKDETYKESLIDSIYTMMLLDKDIEIYNEYKLFKTYKEDIYSQFYNNILYKKIIKLKTSISTYLNLTEQIKKVGEISE